MSTKASFSASIDRDLLERAKRVAADRNTSLSALLTQQLQFLVDTCEAGQQRGNSNYIHLLDFSLGRMNENEALSQLGLISLGDLYRLLAQVGLPRPRLSASEIDRLVKSLHDLCFPSFVVSPDKTEVILIPDCGPLLELANQDQLDSLFKPGWTVALVDAVLHEILRNPGPLSEKIGRWVYASNVPVLQTRAFERAQKALNLGLGTPEQLHMGNLGMQEMMNELAQEQGRVGVFVFEEHKVVCPSLKKTKASKLIATRAFQVFLKEKGWGSIATEPSLVEVSSLSQSPSIKQQTLQAAAPAFSPAESIQSIAQSRKTQLEKLLKPIKAIETQQLVEKIQEISGAAIRLLGVRRMHALQADKKLADSFKNLID